MSTVVVAGLGGAASACLAIGAALQGGPVAGSPSPSRPTSRRWSVRRASLVAGWATVLADRGVEGEAGRWARVALGAALALGLFGAARGGPVGALVALVVGGAAALVTARSTRGRGARRADRHLPGVLEHTGRGLRSGLDLRGALADAGDERGGPHAPAIAGVAARLDGGAGLEVALAGWLDEHPRPTVRLVVGALALAGATGGRAALALDGVAATLRARSAVADEARALASQARASAAVLVALPVVVSAGGAIADRRVADALLGTPWGLACIAAAVVLDTAGAVWMQRIAGGGAP